MGRGGRWAGGGVSGGGGGGRGGRGGGGWGGGGEGGEGGGGGGRVGGGGGGGVGGGGGGAVHEEPGEHQARGFGDATWGLSWAWTGDVAVNARLVPEDA